MLVDLFTGSSRSPIYQVLPFVFDSIFEATGHVVVVVVSKTRSISWQIFEFLSLLLVISATKMQGVYIRARKCLR